MRAKKMHGNEFTANRELKETPRIRQYNYPAQTRRVPVVAILALVFVLLAVMAVLDFKDDTLARDQQQYCDMVALYQNNPGQEIGWPDFRNTFAAECNADGSVKEAK